MLRDLRYAARVLRRSPIFAITAILTMAIGIGANAALFSLADTLYFKALPVRDPDRLVAIARAGSEPWANIFSYPLYRDVRENVTTFADVICFSSIQVLVGQGEGLTPVIGEIVSGNYFAVLGVPVVFGRSLLPEDDVNPGGHQVVVVSDAFWRSQLGADRNVLGRDILINHRPYSVIGVAPPGFTGPILGTGTQLWVPMAMQTHVRPPSAGAALRQGLDLLTRRSNGWLYAVARLQDTATFAQANAELQVVAKQLEAQFPQMYRDYGLRVEPIVEQSRLRSSTRTLIGILFGVVGLVLVVVCTNVAGLSIARISERWREISVRLALGASRARLVRHLVTEHLLLAVCGGIAGLLMARGGTVLLRTWVVPSALELPLDWRVIGFTMLLVTLTGLLIGVLPAFSAARTDVNEGLRGSGTSTSRRAFTRQSLAALQIAVALVLVVGAGLALRTLWNVSRVDPGYTTERLSVVPLDVRTLGMTLDTAPAFYDAAIARVRSIAGVQSAALARIVPLSGGGRVMALSRPGGDPRDEASRVGLGANVITPQYFATLGVRLVAGRDFVISDTAAAERVAVISQAAERELWPGGSAIGKEINTGGDQSVRVVGVVADARYQSPRLTPRPEIFFPLAQQPELGVTMVVRTTDAGSQALTSVLGLLRELEPRLPLNGVTTVQTLLRLRIQDDEMFAWVVTALAGVTLLLATMGLYGVVAFLVQQRRKEVGLRMALGATASSVVAMMLRQHAVFVGVGLVVGIAGAFWIERVLRSRLFEVASTDVATYAVSVIVIASAAAAAAWLPARRAARIDPLTVLKSE